MKLPTFVIDTSDTRMFYAMKYLRNKNFNVCSLNNLDDSTASIYCFSPQKKFVRSEILNINDKSIVFCGNLLAEQLDLFYQKQLSYHNLLQDETFAFDNALLTAESALMLLIRNTDISIFDMNIAILGYGRLGKALATIFNRLGLNFDILSDNYYERSTARLNSKNTFDLNAPLNNYDAIINTIPAKILSFNRLNDTKKSCYILDLASFSAAELCDVSSLGLTYDNALGLPGKYSPKSAGEILAQSILRVLEV